MGKRYLSMALLLFGGMVLVYATGAAALTGVVGRDILLLALILPAAWLRVNLEPAGHLTLAPAVVITAMILTPPYLPVVIAALSAILSAVLFARMSLTRALEDAGEETIPVVLALLLTGALVSFPAGFWFEVSRSNSWLCSYTCLHESPSLQSGQAYSMGLMSRCSCQVQVEYLLPTRCSYL